MRSGFPTRPKMLIPQGVATFLPEGVQRQREMEREVVSVLFRAGYQEVITPLFEYLDTFARTSGEEALEAAYKFVDRATGRLMILRPDVTPQIARMAATLLADRERPLRLCYGATLFRHEEEHAGQEREIFQMGAEYIGASTPSADAEIIALAIEILEKLSIKSFKIVLGHMAFARGVLKPFESDPALFRKILGCMARKDRACLAALLKAANTEARWKRSVLALLDLCGEGDLFKAAASIGQGRSCQIGLKRLSTVYDLLVRKGFQYALLVDLSEVRGFDYYTGTIFEIYADAVGVALGGGGRYDHLLEKFGSPSPAVGFAVNIHRVLQAKESAFERSSPALVRNTKKGVQEER